MVSVNASTSSCMLPKTFYFPRIFRLHLLHCRQWFTITFGSNIARIKCKFVGNRRKHIFVSRISVIVWMDLNWYILYVCHSIVIIDSLKHFLCHKDSKSVLKVDINWWEGWLKERLTYQTDKQTDRQTLRNRHVK